MQAPPVEPIEPTSAPPRRGRWVAAISMIVVAIGGLAAWAMTSPDALAYYKTPSELSHADHGQRIRVGGRMVDGSLTRVSGDVMFRITDGNKIVTVRYDGEVPDTLKDGTDVVAEGNINIEGELEATRVLAKCSSKFVPKDRPQDLGKA